MAFRKVKGEAINLGREVYDSRFKIRIGQRMADQPGDPRRMLVAVGKNKDTLFEFAVMLSETRDENAAGYTFTFTAPLDEVRQGFKDNQPVFAEFGSEEAFVAYVREGTELLFSSAGAITRGSRYVCRLA